MSDRVLTPSVLSPPDIAAAELARAEQARASQEAVFKTTLQVMRQERENAHDRFITIYVQLEHARQDNAALRQLLAEQEQTQKLVEDRFSQLITTLESQLHDLRSRIAEMDRLMVEERQIHRHTAERLVATEARLAAEQRSTKALRRRLRTEQASFTSSEP